MLTRIQLLILSLFLLLVFAVVVRMTCPTVPPRDSGELITACSDYGIPHPPGYPLFVNIGRVFSFVPAGNQAFRQNVASGALNVLSLVFLFLSLFKLTKNFGASFTAVLVFSGSFHFIQYSAMSEVFALNNLIVTMLLYFLISINDGPGFGYLFVFTLGLSFAHHHTIILLFPGMLYYFYSRKISLKRFFSLKYLVIFLIPLSLYLYLYIQAGNNPYMNWGNPSDLKRLYRVVSRADYGRFKLYAKSHTVFSVSLLATHIAHYARVLVSDFTAAGFLLGMAGCFQNAFYGLGFFFSGIFFILLANAPFDDLAVSILEKFYLLPALFFTIGAGITIDRLGRKRKLLGKAAIILTVFFAVLNFGLNSKEISKRYFYYAYDMGKNILRPLDRDSIIFTRGDNGRFVTWYLQIAQHDRPDVAHLDTLLPVVVGRDAKIKWPKIRLPQVSMNEKDFTRAILAYNPDRSVYFLGDPAEEYGRIADFTQDGIAVRSKIADPANTAKRMEESFIMRGDYVVRKGLHFFIREILNIYASVYDKTGLEFGRAGRDDEALKYFDRAVKLRRDFNYAKFHIALAYYKNNKFDLALPLLEALSEKEKDKVDVIKYLAMTYIAKDDMPRGLAVAEKGIAAFPSVPDFYNLAGVIYFRTKNYVKAGEFFNKCLSIEPGYEEARENLNLLHRR